MAEMGIDRGRFGMVGGVRGAPVPGLCRRQFGQPHQVVTRHGKFRPHTVVGDPAVPQLPVTYHRFHPAEDLLDALACPLADPVALMPGGSSVNGRRRAA